MFYYKRIFRLCCVHRVYQNNRFIHVRSVADRKSEQNKETLPKLSNFKTLLQQYQDKIIFNTYLEQEKLELGHFKYYLKTIQQAKRNVNQEYTNRSLPVLPLALQYYVDKDRLLTDESQQEDQQQHTEKHFQLPFKITHNVERLNDVHPIEKHKDLQKESDTEFDKSNIDKWMTNYEYFDDTLLDSNAANSKMYGTPNPSLGVSRIPCGGCGALLHCSDPSIPGYLPSEIIYKRSDEELKTIECQRCHFLKEYNIALDVSVHPDEYEQLLQAIRYERALVILMVDLLDFPCSIWPGIIDIIGTKRPLVVVGNKVDLLPGDSHGYLKRVKKSFLTEIHKTRLSEANIKHVALISAKTGYGVEDLITSLFKLWLYKGDVFLVGCTNVGKSSLFNALLQSDYCKVQAVDIVQRATISRWPGTTLHLLKFPINRPSGWKIYHRTKRLKSEAKLLKIEREIRKSQQEGMPTTYTPSLMGHIGRTFTSLEGDDDEAVAEKRYKLMTLNENHNVFKQSKWLFDTPGVVHPDQILSLLSTEELLLTIPKLTIKPQTYYLHGGQTIFIGGLARVDFVDCSHPCRFTIFCSEGLPITVTKTEDADELYETFLGTELFAVPSGGEKRLEEWPGLQASEDLMAFEGEGPKVCCGDVVLSSVAWVAVTAKGGSTCRVRAWSPGARGLHQRYPSVLQYAVNLKGKRVRDTPAYMKGNIFSEE